MSVIRLPVKRLPRLGHLALLGTMMVLMSCADDEMCTSGAYASVDARLDSALWIYRTGDSSVRGRVAGGDESRIRHWMEGGWYTWASRPTVRPYITDLAGQIVVGGRLGHRDTVVYYDVDSVGILPEDRRKAGIRLQLRSTLESPGGYYYTAGGPYGVGDSTSTYWNLRGEAECTLPFDAAVEQGASFSCTLRATSSDGLAFHMTLGVVSHGPSEYNCTNQIAEGSSAPMEHGDPRVGSRPFLAMKAGSLPRLVSVRPGCPGGSPLKVGEWKAG